MNRQEDLPHTKQIAWDTLARKGKNGQTVIWQDGVPIVVFPYNRTDHARFCMFGYQDRKTIDRINSVIVDWNIFRVRQTLYVEFQTNKSFKVDEYGAYRLKPDGTCKKLVTATSHEGMVNVL